MATNKKTTLNEISKGNPFKVPENYFEDFASRMEEQIASESKVVFMFHKFRPFLYVAASVLVILSVTFVAINVNNKDADMVAKEKVDSVKSELALEKKQKAVYEEDVYIDDIDDEELFDEVYDEFYDDI